MNEPSSPGGGMLVGFLFFLWRNKLLICGVTGIFSLATIIYVLVVPVQYTASTTLLPPRDSSSGILSAAMAFLGTDLNPLSLGGQITEASIQESIIRSRRIGDLINEEVDLDSRYGTEKREARLRRWFSLLETNKNKQGLLTVSYRDKDPEFASRIVGRVVEHLDRFNRENRSSNSRRARLFLEERVDLARVRLNALEDSLADYQSTHHTLALSPDGDGATDLGAQLLSQRIRLVVEAQVLRRTLGGRAPALVAKEMQIDALEDQLARLPSLNSDLAKLLRSRQIYERTYSFLYAQLEESRIEEARNTPMVDILDPPVVPQEKSWPQRTWTVLTVFFVSFAFSLVLARVMEMLRGNRPRRESLG